MFCFFFTYKSIILLTYGNFTTQFNFYENTQKHKERKAAHRAKIENDNRRKRSSSRQFCRGYQQTETAVLDHCWLKCIFDR
jgi:hypothetical protein